MRIVIAVLWAWTHLLLAQTDGLGPIHLVADTDLREKSVGATVRTFSAVEGIEGLKSYRVVDKKTGALIDTAYSYTVSLFVSSDTPEDVVKEQLVAVKDAIQAAHPEATLIRVVPIYVVDDPKNVKEIDAVESINPEAQPSSSRLYQFLQVGLRRVQQRRYQLYTVGVVALLAKMGFSASYWTSPGVLAQDWAFMRYALALSLPQDMAWGFYARQLGNFTQQWPKYLGLRRWIRPEIAGSIFGVVNGTLNAMAFRQIVYEAQQAHPELILQSKDKIGVDSVTTTSFWIDHLFANGLSLTIGPLALNAVRTARLRGWIGEWGENAAFQTLGFESQINGFVLASLPSFMVRYYAVVVNLAKAAIWGAVKLLPAKRGRIAIIPDSFSPQTKDDIYRRLALEKSGSEFDSQFVLQVEKNEDGLISVELPATAKLRAPLVACEAQLKSE